MSLDNAVVKGTKQNLPINVNFCVCRLFRVISIFETLFQTLHVWRKSEQSGLFEHKRTLLTTQVVYMLIATKISTSIFSQSQNYFYITYSYKAKRLRSLYVF